MSKIDLEVSAIIFLAELFKSELFSGTFDHVKVGMFMLNNAFCMLNIHKCSISSVVKKAFFNINHPQVFHIEHHEKDVF